MLRQGKETKLSKIWEIISKKALKTGETREKLMENAMIQVFNWSKILFEASP